MYVIHHKSVFIANMLLSKHCKYYEYLNTPGFPLLYITVNALTEICKAFIIHESQFLIDQQTQWFELAMNLGFCMNLFIAHLQCHIFFLFGKFSELLLTSNFTGISNESRRQKKNSCTHLFQFKPFYLASKINLYWVTYNLI